MNICLACATQRGLRFLKTLHEIAPVPDLHVFSFRETPWEPAYFDAIKEYAEVIAAGFTETKNVAAKEHMEFWEATKVDILFCVSWRYMIPPSIYERCATGAYVFHDSLLPKYRGFSPTVWAVMNGERETGVTLFEIAPTIDSGKVITQQAVPIGEKDTIAEVLERVTAVYLKILRENFIAVAEGTAVPYEQDESAATYCCKLTPEDMRIDWRASTEQIMNMIRAYTSPYPGAYCFYGEKKIHILRASKIKNPDIYCGRIPGGMVGIDREKGVTVLTGDGLLRIEETWSSEDGTQKACDILKFYGEKLA